MRYIKTLAIIFVLFASTVYAEEELKENFPKIGYANNEQFWSA